ncbi:carboxylesterase family protein [Vaginisenegalia massiliensis]|uniref:carboxylesterase family protein n=1 Tax=Vaginisenegalia massiliensis TaxID=2058294 RepID=UPI000F5248B6|nr:carboxylesterase family protein [Vaginisenegalia massiliensis]
MMRTEWKIDQTVIQGWQDGTVIKATGIAYGHAKRFEFPQAVNYHIDQVIQANSWSPIAPQNFAAIKNQLPQTRSMTMSEDCQHLSITIPKDLEPGELVPVMVWIHGGMNTTGGGDLTIYNPKALVEEQRVIVVAITYRLGILGFLPQTDQLPANLALADIILALKWVRDYIIHFGGDPTNITLFGQSAGAEAIYNLLLTDQAIGLFNRVILQSPPLGLIRSRQSLLVQVSHSIQNWISQVELKELVVFQHQMEKQLSGIKLAKLMPFSGQYGQFPLPEAKQIGLQLEAASQNVPIMIGYNQREVASLTYTMPWVAKIRSWPFIGKILFEAGVRAATWWVFVRPIKGVVRRYRHSLYPSYFYRFYWGPEANPEAAGHCVELPFIFADQAAWGRRNILRGSSWQEVKQKGQEVRAIWAEFARSGLVGHKQVDQVLTIKLINEINH